MVIAKEEIQRIVDDLPAEVDLEDLQYRLYLRQKLEAGEAQAADGEVVTDQALGKEIERWSSR